MQQLRSLQYVRAAAAMAVVVFHAAERRGFAFEAGQMGVDAFFVLSGFVMWMISERSDRSPAAFLLDRVARIAPTYWLATLFVLALWSIGIRQGLDHPEVAHTIKSFLFIPAEYPGKDKIYPLVIPGWTLNCEMFFYALFAAALFARSAWMQLLLLTGAMGGLVAIGAIVRPGGALPSTYSDSILLEFLSGVWLGFVWTRLGRVSRLAPAILLSLGLLLIPMLAWLLPEGPRLLVWGAPALLIVSGAALFEKAGTVLRLSWPLILGDASYSIYLWHFPTNPIWDRLAEAAHAPAWLAVVIMIAGGTAFGLAAYALIERPARSWLKTRLKRSRQPLHGAPDAEPATPPLTG